MMSLDKYVMLTIFFFLFLPPPNNWQRTEARTRYRRGAFQDFYQRINSFLTWQAGHENWQQPCWWVASTSPHSSSPTLLLYTDKALLPLPCYLMSVLLSNVLSHVCILCLRSVYSPVTCLYTLSQVCLVLYSLISVWYLTFSLCTTAYVCIVLYRRAINRITINGIDGQSSYKQNG